MKEVRTLIALMVVIGAAIVISGCSKTERVLTGAALGATGVGLAAGLGAGSATAGLAGAAGGGLLGGVIGGATHKDKESVRTYEDRAMMVDDIDEMDMEDMQ